jgi:hypothetical protein
MVGIATMVHAVQRFDCVRASTTTVTTVHWAASLAVLIEYLIRGPRMCLLQRCPKILLLILQ